jgi:hypothetical protein
MLTRAQIEAVSTLQEEEYDPSQGYPARADLVFLCPKCDTFMPSAPANYDEASCQCRYLSIDLDAGRLSLAAVHPNRIEPRLFRMTPNSPDPHAAPDFLLPVTTGLSISLNVLWWWQPLYYFSKPLIEINGMPQPARWGRQDISLPPGSYQVRIFFPYMGMKQCGLAELAITLPDGQWVSVAYTPPFTIFQPGKLRIKQK